MTTRFDRATFGALLIGHMLFLALLVATNPLVGWALTPAFVAPMLVARRRSGRLVREIVVFAVLMTAVHYLATLGTVQIATASSPPTIFPKPAASGMAGAVGGLIGSAGSFAALALFRLVPVRWPTVIVMVAGAVLLTAVASVGLAAGLTAGADLDTFDQRIAFALRLYSPWQTLFAAILAALLLPARPGASGA